MMKIELKRFAGVSLTIKERRLYQQSAADEFITKYCSSFSVLEDSFVNAFKDFKQPTKFSKVGTMFCDGIIMPRLKSLFPKLSFIKIYLRSKKLHV